MALPELAEADGGEGPCAQCGAPARRRCAGCEAARYCGPEHQSQHWSLHRPACPAYRVLRNEKVGRYVVATRPLQAGEEVFSELPVAVGPKVDSGPCCLGCYLPADASTPLCARCGWPACGEECAARPEHAEFECAVFAAAGVRFQPPEDWYTPCPQLECIAPLRVLLAGERDSQRWRDEVTLMEAHNRERRESSVWESNQVNVVDFLRTRCKLDRFPEDQIHSVCGYLEVNAFEARAAAAAAEGAAAMLRGLYPRMGLLSHRCVPNTTYSIVSAGYRLQLRTLVPVAAGAELFASYTHALEPTMVRREQLLRGKHFLCDCARCADPAELGTHLSTLKCSKCDNGWIMSEDPLDAAARWKCSVCDFATPGTAVRKVIALIRHELDEVEAETAGWADAASVERREMLWRKYRSVLHPKHALICQIRHALLHLYGRAEGYSLPEMPDLLLEHKVELARDLLAVADVLKPGCSRLRGTTLYEMHAPLLLVARSQFEQGALDERGLRAGLQKAAEALAEAADILSLEPAETAEGALGAVARASLQQLRASIATLPE